MHLRAAAVADGIGNHGAVTEIEVGLEAEQGAPGCARQVGQLGDGVLSGLEVLQEGAGVSSPVAVFAVAVAHRLRAAEIDLVNVLKAGKIQDAGQRPS